ncbi:sensor histidine kinase ['Paenibacillus yunnanensis' Narsing Rao et al. 2020]|uniref:sensor histidine kinase n=1 Tax=Paenibacillus tengchongensis TaxID=2608684 RepID=UPI00124E4C46|nr:HAMP domain-containing sensor histidine kinase [Paenibacillus tengchongensis]
MKKPKHDPKSRGSSFIFTVMFLLAVFIYTTVIALAGDLNSTLLGPTILFIATVLLLAFMHNRSLQRQLNAMMHAVEQMVDGAMHGRRPSFLFEESRLSALEHRLFRYIEINQASEQSLEAEKNSIKALLSDISHQTKTPLANIMLYSQLLAEQPAADESSRQLVSQISAQSEKLEWLIASLVKLSRLESGMITLQTAPVPVIQTVSRALSQVYTRAEAKGITIRTDCPAQITARHDPQWTAEALFNLLENAVKYTPAGGTITVHAESNEMFTRIEVADTGIGIPAAELEHIFKRFYRGKAARDYEGVGIGLFLSREIINLQGGFMQAVSAVDAGTRITVYLPQS